MLILKPIANIVIDANALLSLLIGGEGAKRIVMHTRAPKLYITRDALCEVEEYIPILAQSKKLSEDLLCVFGTRRPLKSWMYQPTRRCGSRHGIVFTNETRTTYRLWPWL